jgi:hypothetical protein
MAEQAIKVATRRKLRNDGKVKENFKAKMGFGMPNASENEELYRIS